jgi:phosphopantothenoylcysteine synthetase/decarboxylase
LLDEVTDHPDAAPGLSSTRRVNDALLASIHSRYNRVLDGSVALICDGVFLDQEPGVERKPGHIELARWGEMFVILPATANVIGQAANGLATNLLTTTILASPRPVVFCPNVHPEMWNKAAVKRNIETLRADGHTVIEPVVAVGYEVDSGEMSESLVVPEPEHLVERLREIS